MTTKIAITNEKGGCGKTTTAVNVAAILAEHGQRVLLVDADYQSYATTYYGLYQPDARSLYHVLFAGTAPMEAISVTDYGVDVLRASAALKQAEDQLTIMHLSHDPYTHLLRDALAPIEDQYDTILVDCPPQSYRLLEVIQSYALPLRAAHQGGKPDAGPQDLKPSAPNHGWSHRDAGGKCH